MTEAGNRWLGSREGAGPIVGPQSQFFIGVTARKRLNTALEIANTANERHHCKGLDKVWLIQRILRELPAG